MNPLRLAVSPIVYVLTASTVKLQADMKVKRQQFSVGCSTAHAVLSPAMAPGRPDLDGLGRIGKALSDRTRCQILLCLLDGAHYPTELAEHLGLTKANVSNHLACLRGCGLVVTAQEGRRVRYELADPRLAHALDDLAGLALSVTAPVCETEEGIAS